MKWLGVSHFRRSFVVFPDEERTLLWLFKLSILDIWTSPDYTLELAFTKGRGQKKDSIHFLPLLGLFFFVVQRIEKNTEERGRKKEAPNPCASLLSVMRLLYVSSAQTRPARGRSSKG